MHIRDIRLLSKLLFLLYKVGALGVFALYTLVKNKSKDARRSN